MSSDSDARTASTAAAGEASGAVPREAAGPKRPPRPATADPASVGADGVLRPATVAAPKPTRADPRTARQARRASRVAERQAREAERTAQARARAEAKATARGGVAAGVTTAAVNGGVEDAPTVATPTTTAGSVTGRVPAATEPSRSAPTMVRRGRRVQRVVRRIDLWTVLKLALVLYTCLYVAVLLALAALWALAYSTGQISNLQSFLGDVGLKNYRFYGDQMFRACAAIGGVGVLAGTLVTVLTAGLVNAISELTGGIRFVIIEEDVGPPT